MMAYRATPHSTTSLSPNVMVFGRNVVLPCELATGVAEKSAQTIEENSLQQRMNIEKAHDIAREHLKKHSTYSKSFVFFYLLSKNKIFNISKLAFCSF